MFLMSKTRSREYIADLNLGHFLVRSSPVESLLHSDSSTSVEVLERLEQLKCAVVRCFRAPCQDDALPQHVQLAHFSAAQLLKNLFRHYATPTASILLLPNRYANSVWTRALKWAFKWRSVHLKSLSEFHRTSLEARQVYLQGEDSLLLLLTHPVQDCRVNWRENTYDRAAFSVAVAHYLAKHEQLWHPLEQQPTTVAKWLELAERQYQIYFENGAETTHFVYGITLWKRGVVKDYLFSPGSKVRYLRWRSEKMPELSHRTRLVAWGQKRPRFADHCHMATMEDGFIRSIGLGSDYNLPRSLVIDRKGIYYNYQSESDLFRLLRETRITDTQRSQAQWVREQLVNQGLSKYNAVASHQSAERYVSGNKKNILVIGQVDDDASIACSTDAVRSCQELIIAARLSSPDAHLIYRPHPDVVAGNRASPIDPKVLEKNVDVVVTEVSTVSLLSVVQEVHTMTSTVGFEALLRKLPVYCYGMPFYAGWGLTMDALRCESRARALDLDTLTYVTLLKYPRYIDLESGLFIEAKDLITQLTRELGSVAYQAGNGHRGRRVVKKYINIAKASLT